ncbi:MAG TPA: phenylalanine--tRNA ligase subunit alpha, partial [Candidatus Methylomirabilis sp.]|nr:phenylalanine--tRNA ligase subunit alpha [Candidatus Methylomirabilis sp.]
MQDLLKKLDALEGEAAAALAVADESALEALRVRFLGRRGTLTAILRGLGELPPEARPVVGERANAVKAAIEGALEARRAALRATTRAGLAADRLDTTLPGRPPRLGGLHPLTATLQDILEIFASLGFAVAEGPEVELDYYNFEALNIPGDHPARDMQDTFYITDEVLLRTHTSPVQIRVMEAQPPPVRVVVPGKVYRRDADVTHSPMVHQVEGLLVDEGVTFADL